MEVGDLVRLCPQNRQTPIRNSRNNLHMYSNKVGIVLSLRLGTTGEPDDYGNPQSVIARVVWNSGEKALMYIALLEVISESR